MHGTFDGLGRFAEPWLLVLTSLADGPKHGYAIMTDVAAFSGIRMEPGTLYGALSRLERRGWVRPLATGGAAARTRSPPSGHVARRRRSCAPPRPPCVVAAVDRLPPIQYNLLSGTEEWGICMHGKFDDLGRFADPSLLILTSLADGPKHGYAIMTDIAAFSGVSMEPGTLYGALSRLERRGWVRPLATEERRRPYEITAAGQEILAEQVKPRCSRSCRSPGFAPPWRGARDAARAGRPAVPRPGRLPPAALAGALRRGDARRPGPAPPDRSDGGQPGGQRAQHARGPGLPHRRAFAVPVAPHRRLGRAITAVLAMVSGLSRLCSLAASAGSCRAPGGWAAAFAPPPAPPGHRGRRTGREQHGTVWDIGDPARPRQLSAFRGGQPTALSPDGRLVATPASNDQPALWNIANPRQPARIAVMPASGHHPLLGRGVLPRRADLRRRLP